MAKRNTSEEAHSITMREKVRDWFNATAHTRLEPDSCCVIVQARAKEDENLIYGVAIQELTDDDDSVKKTINLAAFYAFVDARHYATWQRDAMRGTRETKFNVVVFGRRSKDILFTAIGDTYYPAAKVSQVKGG